MWQVMGRGLVVVAGVVLAASFAGEVHAVGDSLAVFRPVILVGALAISVLVWRWPLARVLAGVACLAGVWHGAQFVARAVDTAGAVAADIVVYQKNMLFLPADRSAFIADLRAQNADVVTLQEVSRANLAVLDAVRDLYPHQLVCAREALSAIVVMSRTPFQQESCSRVPGMAMSVTQVRGQAVQVVSLHLAWPWPLRQQRHATLLIREAALDWDGMTILGGDFNMVASGRTLAWIEERTQTLRVGPLVRTFSLYGYPIGIDHVLATGGQGALEVRPLFGSDHYGLVARIDLP